MHQRLVAQPVMLSLQIIKGPKLSNSHPDLELNMSFSCNRSEVKNAQSNIFSFQEWLISGHPQSQYQSLSAEGTRSQDQA